MKRYLILAACVVMLPFLGTNQAWSVFVPALRAARGFTALQMQLVFSTGVVTFCLMLIVSGRLHDRFGPRPLIAASAAMTGLAWTLAWAFGASYFFLWLSLGVLAATACSLGYLCPIATGIKWFPRHRGLVAGLTAAGFGCGPILLSGIAEALMRRDWSPMSVFGLVAATYAPAVLLLGMALALPAGQPGHAEVTGFRRRALLRDRRFWTLSVGMFTGTLPFLVVMGNAKPLALDFGFGASAAALAIPVLAIGNAAGRILCGISFDRIGPRRAIFGAQAVVIASLIALIAFGRAAPIGFFGSAFGIGFCYGSNFALYPATVSRLYGSHVIGSVYPFVMVSQALSSLAATLNGFLKDVTGSNYPGLVVALAIATAGTITCTILSRSLAEERLVKDAPPTVGAHN